MTVDAGAAQLLAADVIYLEAENALLEQRLRIALEMLSESLDIAHQSLAYVAQHIIRSQK